jgi:hypothetical protein
VEVRLVGLLIEIVPASLWDRNRNDYSTRRILVKKVYGTKLVVKVPPPSGRSFPGPNSASALEELELLTKCQATTQGH